MPELHTLLPPMQFRTSHITLAIAASCQAERLLAGMSRPMLKMTMTIEEAEQKQREYEARRRAYLAEVRKLYGTREE